MNTSATPDRNILIGALAALIVYAINAAGQSRGIQLSESVIMPLSIIIGFAVAHLTPLSTHELVKKIDDKVVHQAQLDPDSMVSYVLPPVPVPPGEAPTIIPPNPKTP